jgi:acetylornithine deacetylase/succinyl-diaminopimelate desuccinylase-like protein
MGLAAEQPCDAVLGPSTLAATAVDVSPLSRNVIPDRVVVALDWRVLPGTTDDDLLARVRDAITARIAEPPEGLTWQVRMGVETQVTYTGVSRERTLYTPGFLLEPDHPAVRAAALAAGRRDDEGPALIRPWTFATDGGWSAGVHGVPTFGFAPGEERYAHTNRERLDLDEARWAFGRYPAIITAAQDALATA